MGDYRGASNPTRTSGRVVLGVLPGGWAPPIVPPPGRCHYEGSLRCSAAQPARCKRAYEIAPGRALR